MHHLSRLAVVVALLMLAEAPRAQVARHLAAPPSDILAGRVVLPEPVALEQPSTSAVLALTWQRVGGEWVAALDLPVERAGPLALGLLGVGAERWVWELAAPGGELSGADLWAAAGLASLSAESVAPADPRTAVGLEFATAEAGAWRVRVRTAATDAPMDAWLAVRTSGAPEVALRSHLNTHRLLSDRVLPLVARLEGAVGAASGEALVETVGLRWAEPLHDDGRHADGAAGDGVFGAWVGPLAAGPARVHVRMTARAGSGADCVRTAHHAFEVEEPAVVLAGWATSEVLDAQRLGIEIALQPLAGLRRLHLSAEVWGPDARGVQVPVAWLSHIGLPAETYGTTSLALHLDGRWLARAGTAGPLELRRVRVQDPDSHVLFDELPVIALPVGALPSAASGPAGPITPDMLMGAPPPGSPPGPASPAAFGTAAGTAAGLLAQALPRSKWQRALMLSHGYCSSGNVWPPADFSEPKLVFLDPNANRSNDAFAQLIAAAGADKDSFGFVGHSQGGLAALHLLTYYHSGLDFAIGPRRIQSVASPYQGTPLASLGFFACGVNNDMTTSGAPLWLSGIPNWARSQVFYWTTQNSGSACNFFTNLLLASPNDGTVERDRGQLPGANSMGHVSGWCHTTGMSNPANTTDHVRNQQMNATAAR